MSSFRLLTIAGKEHPLSFGTKVLVNFKDATGVDVFEFQENLDAFGVDEIKLIVKLLYYSFMDGHRKANIEFVMDEDDIYDMIDDYPESLTKVFELFSDSQPEADKKKSKATK